MINKEEELNVMFKELESKNVSPFPTQSESMRECQKMLDQVEIRKKLDKRKDILKDIKDK